MFFLKNKEKNIKSNGGFTLIELAVVIFLTLIFIGSAASYNKTSDKLISLYREQGLIVSKIQKAKSLAISTYLGEESNVGCGWGVHFDASQNKIVVFKDIPPQGLNEFERCKDLTGRLYSDDDVILESVSLKDSQLSVGQTDGLLDILFIPPDPTVYFYPNTLEEGIITLNSSRVDNLTLSIRINKFGQISAD